MPVPYPGGLTVVVPVVSELTYGFCDPQFCVPVLLAASAGVMDAAIRPIEARDNDAAPYPITHQTPSRGTDPGGRLAQPILSDFVALDTHLILSALA